MTKESAKSLVLGQISQVSQVSHKDDCQIADVGHTICYNKFWWAYYRAKLAVENWLMSLYRRYAYRHVQRLLHKFNLHYAPPRIPIGHRSTSSERHHWCQWCGLRGNTFVYSPDDPLKPHDY